jgi:hypothetical protein
MKEQVLVLLWRWGYTFSQQAHAVGLGFVEKKNSKNSV